MGLNRKELIDKQTAHNDSRGKALTQTEKNALANVSKQQNDPDWRGQLSPFRLDINPQGVNDNVVSFNSFDMNQYQWYPEGVELKFNDDFYTNYVPLETDGGLFTGTSISDLSTKSGAMGVLNKTKDYAKQQFNGVTSSVKSLFDKDVVDEQSPDTGDKELSPFTRSLIETPHIILYEFQPNSAISELTGMFKAVFASFDQMFDSDNKDKPSLMDNIKKTFSKEGVNDILAKLLPNESLSTLNSARGKIISIPNYFYTNLIGGYYSGQYKLPFFDQSTFLQGMGDQGWESKSMKQRMLGGLGSMMDNFSEAFSAFDIAGKPKWSMDGSGPAGAEITFEMTLFNSTEKSTIQNIRMLNSLVSGNMWTQNIFLQLSPCLYDIEVVGRYRYYFCKADIKVDYVGKQRKPFAGLRGQLATNTENPIGNPNAYSYIPDAYKITVKFVSLIPNNFNMYLNYLLEDTNKVTVGDSRSSTGSALISAIVDSITKNKQDADAAYPDTDEGIAKK